MLMPLTLLAQEMLKVQGTVTDASGEPPIGVNVRTSSSKAGAVTDMDGNYTIEVSPKATLIFSYVGFESLTEAVKGRKNINVTMKEHAGVLNEVVVIGYGTMDKKELTSAISHVGEKDFLTISSLDPGKATLL
jgi:hypothetical protein